MGPVDKKPCRDCGKGLVRGERRLAQALQPWLVQLRICERDNLPYTLGDVFCNKCRLKIQKGETGFGTLVDPIPTDMTMVSESAVDESLQMDQREMNAGSEGHEMDIDPIPDETSAMEFDDLTGSKNDAGNSIPEQLKCQQKQLEPGRRIISSRSILDFVQTICDHGRSCNTFDCKFNREKKAGLRSEIFFICDCGRLEIKLDSDSQEESLPVNDAMAWGCAQAPIGYDAASCFLTTLDLKGPARKTFGKYQQKSYENISRAARISMAEAGKLEKQLTKDSGEFVEIEGVTYPSTTVKVDGCWAKRSYHGHGFNSHCGTAVIIGAKSKKVMFNDTRVRTCIVCDTAEHKGEQPLSHQCFKNWEKQSTAMESSIIAQGFRESTRTHGLVYSKFVGDGDSSTHSAVIDVYRGIEVQKIECSNHIMKNLTRKLMEISQNKSKNIPAIIRRIPNMAEKFGRITGAIVGAINFHSNNINDETWLLLRADILNVPRHVFGDHTFCREYFCPEDSTRRTEDSIFPVVSSSPMYPEIMAAIKRVASLASSLLEHMNTNQAECFMSVVNKYVEGKRKHFGHRYMYALRVSSAVLAYNKTTFWAADAYQMAFEKTASPIWLEKKQQSIAARGKKKQRQNLRRPKYAFLKSRTGDQDYGSHPNTPDLEESDINEFQLQCHELHTSLQVNDAERSKIEESTRDQSASDLWHHERYRRITASNAHLIYRLRSNTDNTATLNKILGRARFSSEDTNYGTVNEKNAIAAYEKVRGFSPGYVRAAGLVVSKEDGILASSPDGFVGTDGLVEVKCPSKWRNKDPKEWPRLLPTKKQRANGDLACLKDSDPYYSQVVMQLFTTDRQWVDFFVWTSCGHFMQRIYRDEKNCKLWESMKLKLIDFWMKEVVPELVDSRYLRGKEYRCPEARKANRDKLALKRQSKLKPQLVVEGATSDLSDSEDA